MDVRIDPKPLAGTVAAIPSKSMAHRLLILAALCSGITDIECQELSDDIKATLRCLKGIGAPAMQTIRGLRMVPLTIGGAKAKAPIDVGESGSTLRFMLPIIAALGIEAEITGHGRLSQRPLSPLDEQLAQHGATLTGAGSFPLFIKGKLSPGLFELPGNVSSQFASGLLMAAPLLSGDVEIRVDEPVESRGYIDLTIAALETYGITVEQSKTTTPDGRRSQTFFVSKDQQLTSPGACTVEGDWSNAAFWLCAGALQETPLTVSGLNPQSRQGDRAVMGALSLLGARIGRSAGLVGASRDHLAGRSMDVSGIPDLVPPLAAVAALAQGTTRLENAGRLRLKESDRLESVTQAIRSMGGSAHVEGDDLIITGSKSLSGGTVDCANDHRIAMMASICAANARGSSTICGAECVTKSYPGFFDDFRSLGGLATVVKE
ncbi:MAG: 3-phosphoshikimate 1-carboxyvinyltransferase [Atopobiaceae bacterium]|nr:3-phosphoshikimate 1-carboxyvinyltransferase [Atopobiaceae bacterium]